MKFRLLFATLLAFPILVKADIYKSVDKDGHVTYSSAPIKNGKKLYLEPLPTMVPPAKPSPKSDFPKVNSEQQTERDDIRRRILINELDSEASQLEKAKQDLTEASPEVYRNAEGKIFRNVARYDEKIKLLTKQIESHEKNISAIKTELSKLK